jgi:hypothetical protein
MAQIINHYSFLLFFVPFLLLVLFVLLRGEGARWKQALSVILVLSTTAGYFLFQPGENALDALSARNEIGTIGKPVLIEFYSDY